MSGGSIAYHLRENKAIERNLFIELLARVGRVVNISDYTYIGFGGPFLEDFKALHAALRIDKMISIEMDTNVYKRQKFNSPSTFINLQNCSFNEFLSQYEFIGGNIIWLDYTAPSELYQQLSEFRQLISKLGRFDIGKITLNANPQGLGGNNQSPQTLHAERRDTLLSRLGDFNKFDIAEDDVLPKKYPSTLSRAILSSVSGLASRTTGEYFQPLSSFVYKDGGHQMLTITGIILNAKDDRDKAEFLETSRLDHWPFRNLDWSNPLEISVPALSAKERLKLDEALPLNSTLNPGNELVNYLGYCPSEISNVSETKKLLTHYAKFYRAFPLFSRVVL